jgi:LCP family protein required for cell wall assembly
MEPIALETDEPTPKTRKRPRSKEPIAAATDAPAAATDAPAAATDAPAAATDAPAAATDAPAAASRKRSPSLAALLSFLWPGLGQLYLGKRRQTAIFAVPSVLVIVLLAYALRRGPVVFAVELFAERTFGLAAVAILVLFGAWRLLSVIHAFLGANRGSARKVVDRAVLLALAAVIVVTHLGGGYYLLAISDAGTEVFDSSALDATNRLIFAQATPTQSPSPDPSAHHGTPAPDWTPVPTATPASDGRVTILLTGASSGSNANLDDTIMVVSYNPTTNSIQMVSVPRDSASFPFYWGGVDPADDRINALATYVQDGEISSPDSPYWTLVKEVQYLLGIQIDYYGHMYFSGFEAMVNKLGGIDVYNPDEIYDPTYDWTDGSAEGFFLSAGPHHLDGRDALAYVRSRHGGGSDWKRSSRQQEVLIDLLHKMSSPSQILKLPSLVKLLGASIVTNFPPDQLADYVSMALNVPSENITQVVLGPPYTITGTSTTNSANCLLNDKVAELSIQLFGTDSIWYGLPAPADTCPSKS